VKNTHVQTFELIEGSSDSNSWVLLFSLCVDVMLRNVCFLVMHLLCICCACDFRFQTEV
jgi:hypothetical protein